MVNNKSQIQEMLTQVMSKIEEEKEEKEEEEEEGGKK